MKKNRIDRWRFDVETSEVDPETGWLTQTGTAALVGVLQYGDRAEFVPAETLAMVDSLVAAPLTNDHPPDLLDIETTKRYQSGTVLESKLDGDRLRVKMRWTDADAIASIQSGKKELSPGYTVVLDETPGEWNGQRYDAIQIARRYNHLALVDRARGGRSARLDWRADALEETNMDEKVAVTINGVEYMVEPAVAAALAGKEDEAPPPEKTDETPKMDSSKKSDETPKMDSADDIARRAADLVISEIRKDRAEVNRAAAELGETIAVCRPLLPQSYRVDGKDVGTIVADAIVAKRPDLAAIVKRHRLDGSRLRGMLDSILTGEVEQKTTEAPREDAESDPVMAAKKRQDERRLKVAGGSN